MTALASPTLGQLAPGVADAVDKAGQEIRRPADAETLQSAAMQQEERDDRKRDEEQAGVEALGRQPRNQQRQQQQRGQDEGQIDPPALRLRIEAVDELREFGLDIGPAGADRMPGILRKTGVAVLAAPDRVDQQEFDGRNDREPQQQRADDGEQDVGRRIEQARAQEADKAGGLDRRGALGNKLLANEN